MMNRNVLLFMLPGLFTLCSFSCEKESDDCNPKLKEDCVCTAQYDPVCGCDGVTYGNACMAACNSVSSTPGECNVDGSFILGEWSFIGYKISENITDSKSVHGYDMTINFERKDKEFKLSGKSSINLYNGSYNLRSNKNKRGLIEITGFLTTKIGGSPKDLNYEHKYLENLSSVAEFQIISNKVIHLFTVNGDFRDMMIFVKK